MIAWGGPEIGVGGLGGDGGLRAALGTDTYLMAVVSELRWASVLARVTDGNSLAPRAQADSLLIDFEHLDAGFYADPQSAVYPDRDIDTSERG